MSSKTNNLQLESANKALQCINRDKKFKTFERIHYNNLPTLKSTMLSGVPGIHCSSQRTNAESMVNVYFPVASILYFVLILLSESTLWYLSLLD